MSELFSRIEIAENVDHDVALAPTLASGEAVTELLDSSWGPFELRPSPRAILRLSLGSAAAIATALAIPDAFSLLPSAPSVLGWAIRLGGLWLYAYLLWATGLLCILHTVRIFGSPIRLDSEGLRLGKIGKPILWSSIDAVSIEERKIFSRVFFIPARELKLHLRKPDGKRTEKSIASFQYLPAQFFSLFYWICKKTANVEPNSFAVFVFKDPSAKDLQKIAEQGRLKKVALTALIACSLLVFLGRKSSVNYFFNMGNRESDQLHYDKAIQHYGTAAAIDYSFAPAWDRLARAEFRVGDIDSAREHWEMALKMKPDFVESKLGLSTIYYLEGNLDKAEALIAKANKLAEFDEAGYLNRAQIDSMTGKNRRAIDSLIPFIQQNKGRDQAICLLGRCYIKQGDYARAQDVLKSSKTLLSNPYNRTFALTVMAELNLAQNNADGAAKFLKEVNPTSLKNPELLVDFARLNILQRDYLAAAKYLDRAELVNKTSPWITLARADISAAQGNTLMSDQYLQTCLEFKYQDPCLYAACARAYMQQGNPAEAIKLAKRANAIDPTNLLALSILKNASKPAPDRNETARSSKPGGADASR